ncbi:winged helix-turn-helix domain-containing protein [Halorussus ruber]|uniref:winged helix-turn-helix domain-containing protein n=1 Tax=Halorussus ruber TaxID=1126238 RepID=UPI001091F429|nr:winged helix-turn-helix domain-containing protein [Halorussus ruber]
MSTPKKKDKTQQAAGEDTVLTDVLGPHAKVKIITVLIGESDRDLNPTDISRLAGIDRSTFYEHIDDLVAYGVVEETRTVGNSQMYQINRDNPAAEDLAQLEWDLLDYIPEE